MNNPNVRHLVKGQPKEKIHKQKFLKQEIIAILALHYIYQFKQLRQTQMRSQSVDVTPAQMDRRRVDRNFDLPEIMGKTIFIFIWLHKVTKDPLRQFFSEDLEEEFRKRLKNEEKIIENKSFEKLRSD